MIRPTRGSSSISSSTASATGHRTGATWSRSTWGTGLGVDRPEERVAQLVGGDAGQQVGRQVGERLLQPGPPGDRALGQRGEPGQLGGGVLERLALEQAGQEQVALLPDGQLLVELDVLAAGQQAPGLELDQGGGDQDELGGDVEVEGPVHPLELGDEAVDDRRQRDLVDVDLAATGPGGAAGRTGPRTPAVWTS